VCGLLGHLAYGKFPDDVVAYVDGKGLEVVCPALTLCKRCKRPLLEHRGGPGGACLLPGAKP
jgi:hypothetical protein